MCGIFCTKILIHAGEFLKTSLLLRYSLNSYHVLFSLVPWACLLCTVTYWGYKLFSPQKIETFLPIPLVSSSLSPLQCLAFLMLCFGFVKIPAQSVSRSLVCPATIFFFFNSFYLPVFRLYEKGPKSAAWIMKLCLMLWVVSLLDRL